MTPFEEEVEESKGVRRARVRAIKHLFIFPFMRYKFAVVLFPT